MATCLLAVVATAGLALTFSQLLFQEWPWHLDKSQIGLGDILKYAFAVTAALGAAQGLVVAYRRQRDNERDDTRFLERFAVAVGQLGDEAASTQVAGVYGLASLADDRLEMRQQCVDVLCGYLRMPPSETVGTTEVRRTVLEVLRRHLAETASPNWCSCDIDLTGAQLVDVNFGGCTFAGKRTSFDRASFGGRQTIFSGASFKSPNTTFRRTNFGATDTWFDKIKASGATLTFRHATFDGERCSIAQSSFTGRLVLFTQSEIQCRHFSFSGVVAADTMSWRQAEFSGQATEFKDVTVRGSLSFHRVIFGSKHTSFAGSRFPSGKVNFKGARFVGRTISFEGHDEGARQALLEYAHFKESGQRLLV